MNDQPHKQKLYCYVDESGQDTEGRFFLVAVVISGDGRDELQQRLEEIEHRTRKGRAKWHRSGFSRRLDYIRSILELPDQSCPMLCTSHSFDPRPTLTLR